MSLVPSARASEKMVWSGSSASATYPVVRPVVRDKVKKRGWNKLNYVGQEETMV